MEECIGSLGNATAFSTTESDSGYRQIKIPEVDRHKTTFSRHHRSSRFIWMPIGLKNASSSFQRAVAIIKSEEKWGLALVYLDGIKVYSEPFTEYLVHVRFIRVLRQILG